MRLTVIIVVLTLTFSVQESKAQKVISKTDSIKMDARQKIADVLETSDTAKVGKVLTIFEAYRIQMKTLVTSELEEQQKIEKAKVISEERDSSLIAALTLIELEKLLPGRELQKRKEEIESKETLSPERDGG